MATEVKLYNDDCLNTLKSLEDNSVDSIVTDPPYGLSFMGKKWDYDVPSVEIWEECLRVLKPGGHLLSFAGSRTYHRMAVRIEDAGFEIRDQIMWIYGSGFPKSHNVAISIDKTKKLTAHRGKAFNHAGQSGQRDLVNPIRDIEPYKPKSEEAKQWEGWGTALKPAHEPIVMARKPFKGTVAQNVLEHGTGAINIDECRVGTDGGTTRSEQAPYAESGWRTGHTIETLNSGRWPANVIHDGSDEVLEGFPTTTGKATGPRVGIKGGHKFGGDKGKNDTLESYWYGDTGSAARFFYCPKSSRKDRNEGCGNLNDIPTSAAKMYDIDGTGQQYNPNKRGNVGNNHPTVKPTDLMAYLIRLVTPKNGITLDPFMGSGSTGKAAVREKVGFIGIEREQEYYDIAQARIKYEQDKNTHHLDNFVGQL